MKTGVQLARQRPRPRCRARCEQPVETARGVSTRLSSTALERAPVIGSAIERRSSPDGPLHRGSLRHRGYPRAQWTPQLGLSGRGSGPTRQSNDQPTTGDPAAPPLPHEVPEQKEPNRLLTDIEESSEHPAHPTALNECDPHHPPAEQRTTHRGTATRTRQRRRPHHLRPQQRPYIILQNTGKKSPQYSLRDPFARAARPSEPL